MNTIAEHEIPVITFEVKATSKRSGARAGLLTTTHGIIETPAFVPVATQAAIKALPLERVLRVGSQLLIANTFHLYFRPGAEIVKSAGGLHSFMNWRKPLMTDSGGFQVFSLGFGTDYGVGKINRFDNGNEIESLIDVGGQPKGIKITEAGVHFRSPLDGKEVFIGPEESIKVQGQLGADITYVFDECTPPRASREYIEESLDRTHRWAERSLDAHKTHQALFGIVQGSTYEDLRRKSAEFLSEKPFAGFGIGGDLGVSKLDTERVLSYTVPYLDPLRPRHLLGIGHPEDISLIISGGVDTFDCIVPTQYARRGVAFTSEGRIDLRKAESIQDTRPIDEECNCETCKRHDRRYISHLLRAGEISAFTLITEHNLFFYETLVRNIREKIYSGEF